MVHHDASIYRKCYTFAFGKAPSDPSRVTLLRDVVHTALISNWSSSSSSPSSRVCDGDSGSNILSVDELFLLDCFDDALRELVVVNIISSSSASSTSSASFPLTISVFTDTFLSFSSLSLFAWEVPCCSCAADWESAPLTVHELSTKKASSDRVTRLQSPHLQTCPPHHP